MPSSSRKTIPLMPWPPTGVPEAKIQARHVSGRFARWRTAMVWLTQLFFYGLPWATLHGRQAVLFDVPGGRFYLGAAVLYPQDLIYLSALLVLSAVLLFAATALAGRVWCGFACPQTVYTQMFQWLALRIEGDRLARLRLDARPWDAHKLRLRGGKHLAWLALSVWTGFTFVGWFSPIRGMAAGLWGGAGIGPWETFWVLCYATLTCALAGHLREKVCQHMCPYGRFQGAMLDRDTLIVAYDTARGEPRATRERGRDAAPARRDGACVDCTVCVQVCPVGIDIRDGLQAACIGCGLCIDACNTVMDKLQAPRGLIRLASQGELAGGEAVVSWRAQLRRRRVQVYTLLLLGGAAALATGWALRPTLRVDAVRDRGVLAQQGDDGRISNVYRLHLMNATERPRRLQLSVQGAEGLTLAAGSRGIHTVWPAQALTLPVTVELSAAASAARAGQILPIRLRVSELPPAQAEGGTALAARAEVASTNTTFVVPR